MILNYAVIFVIIAGLGLSACSKSDGNGVGAPVIQDPTVVTNFKIDHELNEQEKSDYYAKDGASCATTASYDDRLVVGVVFRSTFSETNPVRKTFGDEEQTIVSNSKDALKYALKLNYYTVSDFSGPIFTSSPGNITCTGTNNGQSTSSNCQGDKAPEDFLTPEYLQYEKQKKSTGNCEVKNTVQDVTQARLVKGFYTLSNGTIQAYQHINSQAGDVFCDGKTLGKGRIVFAYVESPQVASKFYSRCKIGEVFQGESIYLSEGSAERQLTFKTITYIVAPIVK